MPVMTEQEAYQAGYDAALNGPSIANCNYQIFCSRFNTAEWERGVEAGKREKERRERAKEANAGVDKMESNRLWTEFQSALSTDDFDKMRETSEALRERIDTEGDWPTNCGRSQVYHDLRLQAEISGLGTWEPAK